MFLFIGISILVGTKWLLCLGRIIAYALNWMSTGFVKYFFRISFLEQFNPLRSLPFYIPKAAGEHG